MQYSCVSEMMDNIMYQDMAMEGIYRHKILGYFRKMRDAPDHICCLCEEGC